MISLELSESDEKNETVFWSNFQVGTKEKLKLIKVKRTNALVYNI